MEVGLGTNLVVFKVVKALAKTKDFDIANML